MPKRNERKRTYARKAKTDKPKHLQNKKIRETTETIVKPYQIKSIQNHDIPKLKSLLSKHNFPTRGTRRELIQRLLKPDATIHDMKRNYHMKLYKKKKIKTKTFKPNNYRYNNGKINHIHQH
eukprot:480670_1